MLTLLIAYRTLVRLSLHEFMCSCQSSLIYEKTKQLYTFYTLYYYVRYCYRKFFILGQWDLQNNMHLDLETFRDSIFAENQSANTLSSLFISSYILFICFPTVYIVVSSANNMVLHLFTQKGRSFTCEPRM